MTLVLVVDDKEENLYYLQALLTGHGYTVETARHGVEALAVARRLLPELVISDLLMPVMDGYALLREWKTDSQLQAVPFIVYTATYTEPEDEDLALRLGADAFIVKPAEPEALLARIQEVEARRSDVLPAAAPPPAGEEEELLERYNERLVRKLEDKMSQLEAANRALQDEIAERKIREAQLRQQSTLLDNAKDAMIVRDLEHRVRYWNQAAERFYGWSQDEVIGGEITGLLHHQDPAAFVRATAEVLANGEWSGRLVRTTRDGKLLTVEASWTLVRDESGAPVSIFEIDTDITERLGLERQLAQSQKLEAIGQLTGGVAHDFNNLLGVISGNLELFDEKLQDRPDLSEMLQDAIRATERGATLTRSLLAFSRQQPLDPRAVDVNGLMREMTALLGRTLPGNIEIAFVATSSWQCDVDTGQLQNAVLNLVVNARDAMPDGGRIMLETADVALDEAYAAENVDVAAGDYVMITVSDTGTGMAADVAARVFEPFFTTKEVGKGTGLGLSMVYGFAKQSLGHVKIYSEVGHGTAVRMYLPRSGGMVGEADADAEDAGADAGGRGETVLVVEDDAGMRRLISELLRSLGYDVLVAADARAALGLLAASDGIAVLLTDVVLQGGMNGRQLAEQARGARPDLRVLYTSGYTENALLHHGRLDAGVRLLQKPFRKRELAAKLRAVLDQESGS